MQIMLFVRDDCPLCPEAQLVMRDIDGVEVFDVSDMEGLAQASHHSVADTPSLLVLDSGGNELQAWRGEVPDPAKVRAVIAQ
jgi:hypothetical protein